MKSLAALVGMEFVLDEEKARDFDALRDPQTERFESVSTHAD